MMGIMPYVEERPDECPNGHPLRGPDRDITVSWLPCLCTPDTGQGFGHRTVKCHACKTTWYDPPHDGRDWIPDAERRVPPVR